MLEQFLAPKFVIIYIFVSSILFVHLRGRVRLKFTRQLTDHSAVMAPYNVLMYMFSAVPRKPILDVNQFPELSVLRDNWRTIREEALQLFDEGYIRASVKNNDLGFNSFFKDGWKRFYLKWYDEPLPSATALCPRTVSLVQSIPTISGAMFALLPPGGRLNKHRDPYAGSLRYHLGLVTPNSDACRIFIDGVPYHWRDGEDMVFDETFVHSAENKSDVNRLILFCDVERPLHTRLMRRINRWFSKHVVRATATQNIEGERVGALNRAFEYFHRLQLAKRRLKQANRPVYYLAKFVIVAGIVYLLIA
jgi:beta-hydroxylase